MADIIMVFEVLQQCLLQLIVNDNIINFISSH
jgi:hypothetical protein